MSFPSSSEQFSHIMTWLSRSKTYPLNLLLDFRDPKWDWEEHSHTFGWQGMSTVLLMLLPHVKRWRCFELLTDTWAPIFAFLWHTRNVVSAPMLQTIALSRCNAYFACKGEVFQPQSLKQPVPLFGGLELENLRHVSLSGVHVDWAKSALSHLVELEFKYHASDVMPSLNQFVNILARCPDLQALSIVGCGPRLNLNLTANELEKPINLTKLRRSIQLPHLTHFSFGFVDVEYSVELISLLSFPALEELVIEDVSTSLHPSDPQDATTLLEWLVSAHTSNCPLSSHTATCCSITSFPLARIDSLELQGVRASEATFSRFLGQFVSLKRLHVSDTSTDVLRALGPASLDSACPFPHLVELSARNVAPTAFLNAVKARLSFADVVMPLTKIHLEPLCTQSISEVERAALADAGVHLLLEDDE